MVSVVLVSNRRPRRRGNTAAMEVRIIIRAPAAAGADKVRIVVFVVVVCGGVCPTRFCCCCRRCATSPLARTRDILCGAIPSSEGARHGI